MKNYLKCFFASLCVVYLAAVFAPAAHSDVPLASDDEPNSSIAAIDVYSFSLWLKVPQVINNTTSQGERRYKSQKIIGTMYVKWNVDDSFTLVFENLENKNFKVGGYNVTYEGFEDRNTFYTRYTYTGSNRTNTFTKPELCFFLELLPSYAIGGNNEDNSFYLLLSGAGTSTIKKAYGARIATRIHGYAAGSQGCGCSAYSHKSPTRIASVCGPSERVLDVVATWGTWTAKWKQRIDCGGLCVCR